MHLKSFPSSKDQVELVQVEFDAIEDEAGSYQVEKEVKMMNQCATE